MENVNRIIKIWLLQCKLKLKSDLGSKQRNCGNCEKEIDLK